MRGFKEEQFIVRKEADLNWGRKGWSGRGWRGRYVGCPEAPDGSESTGGTRFATVLYRSLQLLLPTSNL